MTERNKTPQGHGSLPTPVTAATAWGFEQQREEILGRKHGAEQLNHPLLYNLLILLGGVKNS